MKWVPADKSDIDTAQAAVAAGYPTVAPVLADLIEWLQDYNWPVAQVLASIGRPMIEPIEHVFTTDDKIRKYWMIVCLIENNEALFEHFKSKLIRMATSPTQIEKHEELDEVARDALAKFNIDLNS